MTRTAARAVVRAEREEPVLEFLLAKSLGYRARMAWTVALVAVGFALQVAFLSPFHGLPFLLAAVLLAWVVGFDNQLDRRGLAVGTAWRTVPFEKVREIVDLDRRMRRWDESAVDFTNPTGCGLLAVAAVAVGLAALAVTALASPSLGAVVAVDGAVLVLLQWFSGMRTLDRRPDLVLRARHLTQVASAAGPEIERLGAELRGQLRLAGSADALHPEDVRMVVRFPASPRGFLGVQGQVVLNRVQGTPHPYFYAVVIAPRGSGLLDALGPPEPFRGVVLEPQEAEDVDLVVVRQLTTKTSGYHTGRDASVAILERALALAAPYARVQR